MTIQAEPRPSIRPLEALQPVGWPEPKGYANAMMGEGRVICLAGQVGWDAGGRFADGLVAQVRQTLENILAILAEAGAGSEHIARMTWFVLDIEDYRASLSELGSAYREVMGRNFPAMTLVQVSAFVEREALVEIEATAIVPR